MKRNLLLNRIISFSLIVALYLSMSASAFADGEDLGDAPQTDSYEEVDTPSDDSSPADSSEDVSVDIPDDNAGGDSITEPVVTLGASATGDSIPQDDGIIANPSGDNQEPTSDQPDQPIEGQEGENPVEGNPVEGNPEDSTLDDSTATTSDNTDLGTVEGAEDIVVTDDITAVEELLEEGKENEEELTPEELAAKEQEEKELEEKELEEKETRYNELKEKLANGEELTEEELEELEKLEKELIEKEKITKPECEHELIYEPNKDGTHTVKCSKCEKFEEYIESCEYDDEGKCIKCKQERPKEPVLEYEDDEVIIRVSGAIPENADLKVTPIKEDNEETKEAFDETASKIKEESDKIEETIAGFVAYDICFIDIETNEEVEPDGDVTVSLEYKGSTLPVSSEAIGEAEVISVDVMHIIEDSGELENLSEQGNASVEKNDESAVTSAEFTNDSFSTYVLAWKLKYFTYELEITTNHVDEEGNPIEGIANDKHEPEVKENDEINLADWQKEITGRVLSSITYKDGNEDKEVTRIKFEKTGSYSYKANLYNGDNSTPVKTIELGYNKKEATLDYHYREDISLKVKKVATGDAAEDNEAEYKFIITDEAKNPVAGLTYKIDDQQFTTDATGSFILHTTETAEFIGLAPGNYTITEDAIQNTEFAFEDFTTQIFDGETKVQTYNYDSNEKRLVDITVTADDVKEIKFKNCETKVYESSYTAPKVSKYVEDRKDANGNSQDKYGLAFKFKGPSVTETPYINEEEEYSTTQKLYVDIVVVMDKSGSMETKEGGKTRVEIIRNAVYDMVDVIADKDDVDAKWQVVDFAKQAKARTSSWVGTESVKQYVDTAIASSSNSGIGRGTNYEAGLTTAKGILDNRQPDPNRPNAKKIVLFLTDGEPTYYGISNIGGGGKYLTHASEDHAYTAAANVNCDYFYAVGIGLGDIPYYSYNGRSYTSLGTSISGSTLLENLVGHNPAPADNKGSYNIAVTAASSILKSLAGIIVSGTSGNIVPGEPKTYYSHNIDMYDTLSSNVQLQPNSIFYINVSKDGENLTESDEYWTDGQVDENRNMTTEATYTLPDGSGVILRATIEKNNAGETVIRLIFPSDYVLDQGYDYSVKVFIEPTDSAYDYYDANKSYPDTGDDRTDRFNEGIEEESGEEGEASSSEELISSKKPGFYTNGAARTNYILHGKNDGIDFPKPVVPVHFKTNMEIFKVNADGTKLNGGEFRLQETGVEIDQTLSYTGTSQIVGDTDGLIVWDLGDGESIASNKTYKFTETAAPTGYVKSEDYWIITVSAENVPTVERFSAEGVSQGIYEVTPTRERNVYTYRFEFVNLTVYTLPETGGDGIYRTTMLGVALMLTSTYLFYRNRRRQRAVVK